LLIIIIIVVVIIIIISKVVAFVFHHIQVMVKTAHKADDVSAADPKQVIYVLFWKYSFTNFFDEIRRRCVQS